MTPYKVNGYLTEQQKLSSFLNQNGDWVSICLAISCFRRFKYIDIDLVDDIPKIVIVAYVLHNISLCNEDSFLDFMDDQDDEVNSYS